MRRDNLLAGVIGKDGRTSAICKVLSASPRVRRDRPPEVLSEWKKEPPEAQKERVLRRAAEVKPDFVIVGPEDPLAQGIVDALQHKLGIPCIGPTQELAKLESSKAFTRRLVSEYGIAGNPEHRVFTSVTGVREYLNQLGDYVVKPDGLTGGKGVKLSGEHLQSIEDAMRYCEELLGFHGAVVIEEKLEGEEFSLQSFCDGQHVRHMILVQDHKRAWEGDTGPNTGGMGSYSCEDHGLPFVTRSQVQQAETINEAVAKALLDKTKQKYKGILYGGFMATKNGIRLLEYNARFGDPETLNVLSVLKTDFVDICEAIIEEKLDQLEIAFEPRATVCKYIVPEGYPDSPKRGVPIDLSGVPPDSASLKSFQASIEQKEGLYILGGSRAIAFVGIAKDLAEAEAVAEQAASAVKGPVYHRRDIGTQTLIQRRIDHMRSLIQSARIREIREVSR